MNSSITSREFGRMPDGRAVTEYTLDNGRGLSLSAINLGGIVTALHVPDREGQSGNIVLGLPTLEDYLKPHPHFGTIVGRYANRIARGRFMLDGVAHQLAVNDGANSLHGGHKGFGTRFWHIEEVPAYTAADEVAIELRYTSADGEEGFPGEVRVTVRYVLGTTENTWRIDYRAVADRATVLNLSHHDYFNLAGGGAVRDHRLTIPASRFCPVDAGLIPLGLAPVNGTPFDFRVPTHIGARMGEPHEQLRVAGGYDHNWVLDREPAGMALAARLEHEPSGRVMEVLTTEPAVQFYSGNFLDGSLRGRDGETIRQGAGLCLETQHYPDSPNQPSFPSTVLRPGEAFSSSTLHRFGVA
ncbi:aldose epimerase family protein [Variovorax paradoxus]|uniref:aldose epimerase family protein n=1 Tax=Variovorax paradoxus TaxID=34073 RepID=UPI0024809062|nr:aldose epimerase family protein [Variovorax paradoxus]WGT62315.1 aldose epimerase family protein [Variovorax paradoxus]